MAKIIKNECELMAMDAMKLARLFENNDVEVHGHLSNLGQHADDEQPLRVFSMREKMQQKRRQPLSKLQVFKIENNYRHTARNDMKCCKTCQNCQVKSAMKNSKWSNYDCKEMDSRTILSAMCNKWEMMERE
jgi:hypothetical protein